MKVRVPKNNDENNVTVIYSNQNLAELLSKVEEDFNRLVNLKGEDSLLNIGNVMLTPEYLAEFTSNKHNLKFIKQKIFSLLESKIMKISGQQYETEAETKQEKLSKLDILVSINSPKYLQEVLNSNLSQEIKQTVQNSVKKMINQKLEKLEISQEEFEQYIKDPKSLKSEEEKKPDLENKKKNSSKQKDNKKPDLEDKKENSSKPKESKETVLEDKSVQTSKTPAIISNPPAQKTFFEQVKGYTRNFQHFIVTEEEKMAEHTSGKFTNYENYLKFYSFINKLGSYMVLQHKTELEAIDLILNKKSKEFSKIDKDFIKILTARKNVILSKEHEK